MADVFLGLGSNEGNRAEYIKRAINHLEGDPHIRIGAVSSLYDTKPLGNSDQPEFLNCVVRINTDYTPLDLLRMVKEIELHLGRHPNTHMLPRTMDIDILLYDNIDLDTLELRIPHSRLLTRRFVLEPLLEIDDTIVDPLTREPLVNSLEEVKSQKMIKYAESSEVWHE